jgi:hypothetical protein
LLWRGVSLTIQRRRGDNHQWLVFTFGSIIALMLVTAYVTVEVTPTPSPYAAPSRVARFDRLLTHRARLSQLGAVRLND